MISCCSLWHAIVGCNTRKAYAQNYLAGVSTVYRVKSDCCYSFVLLHAILFNFGHAGSAIKVLVAIHYSVLDARNGYIRNVVV